MLRRLFQASLFAAVFTACGAPEPAPAPDPEPGGSPEGSEIPARTADPFKRGLTEADFPRVQELAPGVYSYEQLRAAGEELFTTVSMFVVTDEGVLVADGQGSFDETARMVEEIGKITDQPITHVVIASDHGDHTAGNAAFPGGGRVHRARELGGGDGGDPRADSGDPDAPNGDLGPMDLTLGGRVMEVLFLGRAHTGGDLVVHLPEESVLFLTEAYLHRVYPAMRSAYPTEWVAMLRRAEELNARVNIPGHGFVDSPEMLREELGVAIDALETVIAESTRLHHLGLSAEEADAQADFGDLETWSLRESQRGMALRRVYMELNGELP